MGRYLENGVQIEEERCERRGTGGDRKKRKEEEEEKSRPEGGMGGMGGDVSGIPECIFPYSIFTFLCGDPGALPSLTIQNHTFIGV